VEPTKPFGLFSAWFVHHRSIVIMWHRWNQRIHFHFGMCS